MTWPTDPVDTSALDAGTDTPPRAVFFSWAQKFNSAMSHVSGFMQGLLAAVDAAAARLLLDVPSRSGSGASGTWGISISGNAATAGAAVTAVTATTAASATTAGACSGNSATATSLTTASGAAPSYAARAWARFNGTGTPAIIASGNVSSITDYGTGDFGINFTTAMPDANYCVVATVGLSSAVGGRIAGQDGPQSSSQARIAVRTDANVATDTDRVNVVIFR